MTRNYFVLYSGDAAYKLLKYDKRTKGLPRIKVDPFADRHSAYTGLPKFRGTLVGVDIALPRLLIELEKVGRI